MRSNQEEKGEISARARFGALELAVSAWLSGLFLTPEADAAEGQKTGEFLAAALTAVLRTGLHEALASLNYKNGNLPTIDDWKTALVVGGDSYALSTLSTLLDKDESLGKLFTKMLQPANREAVIQVGQLIWECGKTVTARTGSPWSGGAPHPKGQDLINLIKLLSKFSEGRQKP